MVPARLNETKRTTPRMHFCVELMPTSFQMSSRASPHRMLTGKSEATAGTHGVAARRQRSVRCEEAVRGSASVDCSQALVASAF